MVSADLGGPIQLMDSEPRFFLPLECSESAIVTALNEAERFALVLNAIPNWVSNLVLVDGRSRVDSIRVAKTLWRDVLFIPRSAKGGKKVFRLNATDRSQFTSQ